MGRNIEGGAVCNKLKRDNGYVMFSYNQIESDFYLPLVRECRGVVLEEATVTPEKWLWRMKNVRIKALIE